jgi:hypothetical protein
MNLHCLDRNRESQDLYSAMHDSLETLLAHIQARLLSADAAISADAPRMPGSAVVRPRAKFSDLMPTAAVSLAHITTPAVDAHILRTLWTASAEISGPFVLEWLNNAMRASSESVSVMDVNSVVKSSPPPFPPIPEVRWRSSSHAHAHGCALIQ